MANALVPSDKPVCGSLKLSSYPHNLGPFSFLNRQIWNKTLSPSVVSVGAAIHSANVSIAYCLPTLTPPSVSVADFCDFLDALLKLRRASPSFAMA